MKNFCKKEIEDLLELLAQDKEYNLNNKNERAYYLYDLAINIILDYIECI